MVLSAKERKRTMSKKPLDVVVAARVSTVVLLAAGCSDSDGGPKVLARDVVVDNAANVLESADLQAALDDEMAIDLSELLPGTTWDVVNEGEDQSYGGTTGQVSFAESTMSVDSGSLGAAGLAADVINPVLTGPIAYKVFGNEVILITWYEEGDPDAESAFMAAIARKKDTIVVWGLGGHGVGGTPRVSVLTKVSGP